MVRYKSEQVGEVSVAYRQAGEQDGPKLVLLGGFPSSSHQFRDLTPALAARGFNVVAPDYPGFGNTQAPEGFEFTFDHLSEVIERFLARIGFTQFGLYHQDYGGPIGNRIIGRHPDWLEWQIVQNSNMYDEGFGAAWDAIRHSLWLERNPETEAAVAPFTEADGVKRIYLTGHRDPELISPDNWQSDLAFLERPGRRQVQLDLLYDYRTNPPLFADWQAFARARQPETLIFWGQGDVFFTPEGGDAYLRDLPEAEIYRLDSGHFAVEDHLEMMAHTIRSFYDDRVAPSRVAA
jgi:pimeloyl-ACP methyl ester carboxylesterase